MVSEPKLVKFFSIDSHQAGIRLTIYSIQLTGLKLKYNCDMVGKQLFCKNSNNDNKFLLKESLEIYFNKFYRNIFKNRLLYIHIASKAVMF